MARAGLQASLTRDWPGSEISKQRLSHGAVDSLRARRRARDLVDEAAVVAQRDQLARDALERSLVAGAAPASRRGDAPSPRPRARASPSRHARDLGVVVRGARLGQLLAQLEDLHQQRRGAATLLERAPPSSAASFTPPSASRYSARLSGSLSVAPRLVELHVRCSDARRARGSAFAKRSGCSLRDSSCSAPRAPPRRGRSARDAEHGEVIVAVVHRAAAALAGRAQSQPRSRPSHKTSRS